MKAFVIFAIILVALGVESKTFTRCELAQELRRQNFPEADLRNWVCLIEAESSRNTGKVGPVNRNRSRDYGLFQINDKFWCSNTETPGKDCNVRCEDVLTDDITKASTCAKKIFKRHGFNAWYGWKRACQGPLPSISSC